MPRNDKISEKRTKEKVRMWKPRSVTGSEFRQQKKRTRQEKLVFLKKSCHQLISIKVSLCRNVDFYSTKKIAVTKEWTPDLMEEEDLFFFPEQALWPSHFSSVTVKQPEMFLNSETVKQVWMIYSWKDGKVICKSTIQLKKKHTHRQKKYTKFWITCQKYEVKLRTYHVEGKNIKIN